MRKIRDIRYCNDNDSMHLADVILPDTDGFDMLLYIHGGGLVAGSRKESERLHALINYGFGIVSVEYSLLPKANFPDFIREAALAVAFIQSRLKEWGGNGRLFIFGASAGAYITMMLCLNPDYLQSVGVSQNSVSGFISESAQQFAHFSLLEQRGFDGRIERIDETAPIGFVKDSLSIRPLLLLYYSDDLLCRPEENRLMYQSMKRFVPRDSVLEIQELSGTHCCPEKPDDLIRAILKFTKRKE